MNQKNSLPALSILALAAGLSLGACDRSEGPSSEEPTAEAPSAAAATSASDGYEPVSALTTPDDLNMDKVLLGRSLFHDTRLSGDGTIACVSCHSFDHGGAEPRRVSTGIGGAQGPINAPTVLNAGLNFVQFWDGRAANLQAQAAGPVANPIEMGAEWSVVLETLSRDEALLARFAPLYEDGITEANVTDAIAEYERSLLTPSRFDRYLEGTQDAISSGERAGYELFKSVGCTACHSGMGVGGGMYQKMGLVRDYFADRGHLTEVDNGRFNVTGNERDLHHFKVPSLRNIAQTSPYFHDGSQATLEGAVEAMGRYQLGRELNDAEVASIVTFLNSLSGELPAHARPPATESPAPAAP